MQLNRKGVLLSKHCITAYESSNRDSPLNSVWVRLHKFTTPDTSEIPALTGLQFNHKKMNKV